ncbi:MAG: DUF6134 family protein [Parvibaculum sp.]
MKNKLAFLIPVLILSALSVGGVTMASATNAGLTDAQNPLVELLYGDSIKFDVVRNGARIGSHNVVFERRGDILSVVTDFQLEIGALFITLFELNYRSEDLWRNDQLVSLTARTDQNGDVSQVTAEFTDGLLRGQGPNGAFEASPGVYPTNHWNAGVRGATQLINTITGRVSDVRLVPIAIEQVQTERGFVEATRYKYVGAIENEIWYDNQGRWVRMQFPGNDGSLIELSCRKCFPREMVTAPKAQGTRD